jgi:hypothetical protein
VLFMAGWLGAETWQGPGYSVVSDTISDMQAATAPHVWFPIACFAIGGIAPWMLAFAGLAIGNSFPLIPCQVSDYACSAHRQLYSPGGMTDAVVATAAFLVLAFIPGPLWRRLQVLPQWRRLKPVMVTARVVCPVCFLGLCAEGIAERMLSTTCVLWLAAVATTAIHVSASSPAELTRKAQL